MEAVHKLVKLADLTRAARLAHSSRAGAKSSTLSPSRQRPLETRVTQDETVAFTAFTRKAAVLTALTIKLSFPVMRLLKLTRTICARKCFQVQELDPPALACLLLP